MSDKDEKKKSHKKKRHTKHYYYYVPDEVASEDDYCYNDYYASTSPRLSKEKGLMLYERASAAQKRLESILMDETRQKMHCVREMGRINGHLIAENQQLHDRTKGWEHAVQKLRTGLSTVLQENRGLEDCLYHKRLKYSKKYAMHLNWLRSNLRDVSSELKHADERACQLEQEKSYYRHGYKEAYAYYASEYQRAIEIKQKMRALIERVREEKRLEKIRQYKMHKIAHQLEELATEALSLTQSMDLKAKENECEEIKQNFHWLVTKYHNFPCRVNHAALYSPHAGRIFSFGGYCSKHLITDIDKANPLVTMDIQSLDPHNPNTDWEYVPHPNRIQCENISDYRNHPEMYPMLDERTVPRFGHTAVTFKDKIFIIGGFNIKMGGPPHLVLCYDITRNVWFNAHCKGDVPLERDAHACCSEGNLAYLHGGIERSMHSRTMGYSNELYALDMEALTWEKLPTVGCVDKLHLIFHTLTPFGNKIFCFGGEYLDFYYGGSRKYNNTMYCYNKELSMWDELTTSGVAPEGRRSHSAIKYRNGIIIFGGGSKNSFKHFNDLFLFNSDTYLWTRLKPWGKRPHARRRAGTCLIGSKIFMFGGASPSDSTIEKKEYEHTFTGSSDDYLVDLNDTHILELEPSLKMLCVFVIISNNLHHKDLFRSLPASFQEQIKDFHGVTLTSKGNVGPNEKA